MPRTTTPRDTTRRDTAPRGKATAGRTDRERLSRRVSRALALETRLAQWGDRAAWLLVTPLRAARTDTGKRVLTVAATVLALAATVRALHASAEPPTRLPDAPVAASSPAPAPADPARQPDPAPAGEETAKPPAATVPPNKPVKPTPEEAAVAFWAAELNLPENRLRPLMQQRINDNSVTVLVLAERAPEDLPTRLIQVNRTQTGWRVP